MSEVGLLGREAVILVDEVEVGYAENVKFSIHASLIKKYAGSSDKPQVLKSGNKSFPLSFGRIFVDKSYAEKVLSGAPVTVEVRPAGTGATLEKYTYTGFVFDKFDGEWAQDGIVGENVSGEAKDCTIGTQSA